MRVDSKETLKPVIEKPGKSILAYLWKRVERLTVSKAFEKSTVYTMTYLLLASMEVIVWRMEMRAAVVEPHGRNANWSDIVCK